MEIKNIHNLFKKNYYCHLDNFHDLITFSSEEELKFKKYWDRLVLDQNFKEYTHRERRILRYTYQYGQPLLLNQNSEYQSTVVYDNIKYQPGSNQLTYVEDDFIINSLMQQIIATDIAILGDLLNKEVNYAINIHLFRVEANNGKISPTTSGIHQDGMDLICMHFINSHNIHPVISRLYEDKTSDKPILTATMSKFLEVLMVNDKVLYHSASSVEQIVQNEVAFRDLLLVTFNATSKQE